MSFPNKLRTIFWKNCVVRKRSWLMTLFEICFACIWFFFVLYLYLKDQLGKAHLIPAQTSIFHNETALDNCFKRKGRPYDILYTPNDQVVNNLMENVNRRIFNGTSPANYIGLKSERELETWFYSNYNESSLWQRFGFGIVFEKYDTVEFKYKIRSTSEFSLDTEFFSSSFFSPYSSDDNYVDTCFSSLQKALDQAFIESNAASVKNLSIGIQAFPKPEYVRPSGLMLLLGAILGNTMVISFLVLVVDPVKRIAYEKETGAKELMKLMGLKSWMVWAGWLINVYMVGVVVVTVITVVLKIKVKDQYNPLLEHCNVILLWLLLMLFLTSITMFVFIVAAVITKPLIALLTTMIIYIVPFVLLNTNMADSKNLLLLLLCCVVCPPFNWSCTSKLIIAFESSGGLNFGNLFETSPEVNRGLTMGWLILCYILSIILYTFLTWYLDNVRPGPYGRARPFYFIFEFLYKTSSDVIPEDQKVDEKFVEKAPSNNNIGISVHNLTKVFPGGVFAVNGVSFDVYKGQITALLGHNGAGKTTTMSILTGMYSPTSGSVFEHTDGGKSYNVFENMNEFRNHLGLCPQHNLFISYFTVFEHLIFFGMLKGMTSEKAAIEGDKLLRLLNIIDKKDKMTTELSGGMKRKLSLAIALIGDPKILILDEPTSGLDPESRRELWNVLLSIRHSRTIIITTHFMEEADVLGDRIAIMDHGKLVCYGSPIFLKKLYGTGYNLTLLTNREAKQKQITGVVKTVIEDGSLKTTHKGQLTYALPAESTSKFHELFSALEHNKQELGITSMGISLTTMEEVFLRADLASQKTVLGKERNGNNEEQRGSHESTFRRSSSIESDAPQNSGHRREFTSKKVEGISLSIQRFGMLFKKKVLYTFRRPLVTAAYTFLALLMFVVGGLMLRASQNTNENYALELNLDHLYQNSEVFIGYKSDSKSYADTFKSLLNQKTKTEMYENRNMTEVLLDKGRKDLEYYKYETAVASDWNSTDTVALHSSFAIHSAPIALNLVSNTISKMSGINAKLTVKNHPLSLDRPTINPVCKGDTKIQATLVWFSFVPLGLLFVVGSFIAFPLEERLNNAKQLQLMTGLSAVTYWVAVFLWDLLIYTVTVFLALIIVYIIDVNGIVTTGKAFGVLIVILFLYGLSTIPCAYFFSYLLNSTAGLSKFIMWNIAIGIGGSFIISMLRLLPSGIISNSVIKIADYIMLLDPHYATSRGIYNYLLLSYDYRVCNVLCSNNTFVTHNVLFTCGEELEYFKNDERHILKEMIFLGIDFVFYFFLIALIEFRLWAILKEMVFNMIYSKDMDMATMDDDVKAEKDRVDAGRTQQGNPASSLMTVDKLAKRFRSFQAVRGISFQVASGECFGLLGVNGAGKTTTFRMLTGDELSTAGNATITKYSLDKDRTQFISQIGYCPQFDGINSLLTGRETLELIGRLRGLTAASARNQAIYWIDFLGFTEYADRQCGNYSGGNKRKLSTAMALIADPVIVFLDEPTSGVDPLARRKLWDVLTSCQKSGQSFILTSHSMDECEALCNRLTIMVRGQMMCIGNIQYLKQRFGQGFTIMVKISTEHQGDSDAEKRAELKHEIETQLEPNCLLKDEHAGLLHYHVTNTNLKWSYLFKTMEDVMKKSPLVEDYTISETTLEQVFISFAKQEKAK